MSAWQSKLGWLAGWLAGFRWPDHALGWTVCPTITPSRAAPPNQTPPGISLPSTTPSRTLRLSAAQRGAGLGAHWPVAVQALADDAPHCTAPCHAGAASKQASKQAIKHTNKHAPCASSQSLPDAERQMPELQTNCTAPHCTAPAAPTAIPSSPSLPLSVSFPSFQPLHLASPTRPSTDPPVARSHPPLPVWLRRSSRHRISADVFSPGPGFVFSLFFFFFWGGGGEAGIRYVGSGCLGCSSGFGMTRMMGRDAARQVRWARAGGKEVSEGMADGDGE